MNEKVIVNDLEKALKEVAEEYIHEVTEEMNEAAKEVAEELKKKIRRDAPKGMRRIYYRYGSVKTIDIRLGAKKFIWHVAKPEYRLAHLLEHGHQKARGGGTTRAFPHIKKNEEEGNIKYYDRCMEIVRRAGKK